MKTLEHITITTGSARVSPRSEVGDDTVAHIRKALAKDGDIGANWRVKLLPTPDGGHAYDLLHKDRHFIRCWLCEDQAVSKAMWGAASSSGTDPRVKLVEPTSVPWLAVSLTLAAVELLVSEPNVLYEAGDVERCVAWAILE